MRPSIRTAFVLVIGVTVLVLASTTAIAQPVAQESPCFGQLCVQTENIPTIGVNTGPVNDPGGNYIRSFIVMAVIAIVVGVYLSVALGGRRLPFRRQAAR